MPQERDREVMQNQSQGQSLGVVEKDRVKNRALGYATGEGIRI